MKKIMFIGIILSLISIKLYGAGKNFDIWRTTTVRDSITNARVTDLPAFVWKIEVTTGVAGSWFQVFGGSQIATRSSTFSYATDSEENKYEPLLSFPTGFMYSAEGTSEVTLYWDFLFKPTSSQAMIGLNNK